MQLSYSEKLGLKYFFHAGIYGKYSSPREENANNLTCIAAKQLKQQIFVEICSLSTHKSVTKHLHRALGNNH